MCQLGPAGEAVEIYLMDFPAHLEKYVCTYVYFSTVMPAIVEVV